MEEYQTENWQLFCYHATKYFENSFQGCQGTQNLFHFSLMYNKRRRFTHRSSGSRTRATFTKLLRDETATMSNVHQAVRFVEGMNSFDSKSELLSELDDPRKNGTRRLREALSYSAGQNGTDTILMAILRNILNEETMRPLNRCVRNRILSIIYHTPGLLEDLTDSGCATSMQPTSAHLLCMFLLETSKAFVEARKSERVQALGVALRDRQDVPIAEKLCFILGTDNENDGEEAEETLPYETAHEIVAWGHELLPPGGRHNNDFANYRNVALLPTLEEMVCETPAWLPLANGSNAVVRDASQRLLDSNFRLLRADAVQSMITNVAENQRIWRRARVVGMRFSSEDKKAFFKVSFVLQCEPRSASIDWVRSRALSYNSVVGFCLNGVLVRIGTITIRNEKERGRWLNAPAGPMIGVTVDSDEEFDASLREMLQNAAINEKVNDHCQRLANEDGNLAMIQARLDELMTQMTTYDLIELSQSFFTYKPILETLQEMTVVPAAEELVHCRSSDGRPEYLPQTVRMPNDKYFKGYVCDLDNWSMEDVVKNTSLDTSQAEAIYHGLTNSVALIQGPPGTGKVCMAILFFLLLSSRQTDLVADIHRWSIGPNGPREYR